jgi:hypothetical protein
VPIAKKEIPVLPEHLLFTASDYQIGIYSKFSTISQLYRGDHTTMRK